MLISGHVILATEGSGAGQWIESGWLPLVWGGVALIGYLAFMFFNPLRGYLGESFDLLSEKGHARLWALVGVLSLPGMAWDWWKTVPANQDGSVIDLGEFQAMAVRPEGLELISGVLENVGAVFSVIVGGSELGMGIDARGGFLELAGGAFVVALGILVQYFLLLFVYLRVMMPGRALKVPNLLDLSVRRIGTTWPVLVACWLAWCIPLAFGFTGTLAYVWSIVFSAVFIVCAFLEVSVLAKNVHFTDALSLSLSSWRKKGGRAIWFLAAAALHGVLLFFAAFILNAMVVPGTWLALVLGSILVFIRAYVMVWLLGAWVVIWAD